jgi:hypothetical protein
MITITFTFSLRDCARCYLAFCFVFFFSSIDSSDSISIKVFILPRSSLSPSAAETISDKNAVIGIDNRRHREKGQSQLEFELRLQFFFCSQFSEAITQVIDGGFSIHDFAVDF